MKMDVIDVLGDLLIDLEKTAASSPSPRSPRLKEQQNLVGRAPQNSKNMSNGGGNLLVVPSVEPSFLYAPDRDILTGQPLIRTPSPGPLSPRLLPPRPSSAMTNNEPEVPAFGVNDSNEDFKFQSYHLDYKYTPPPIKGPCCVCGDGIMGAMVTALDKMWHPEHFTCVHCGIELRSPMYLEHDAKPYCKICHGKLFLPPCAHCKKDIAGNYINAMNKVWHPDCFKCHRCSKVLTPTTFFEKEGKPYCEDDYYDLFFDKCFSCKKPIKDDRKISVLGRHWHPEHFKCCQCGCQLTPTNFKEKNGKLYCEKDFNDLFMPKCNGCHSPVVSTPTTAMGKTWHPKCFSCTDCKRQLNPDRFSENSGKPYCDDCYHNKFSPKCAGCKGPIKDPKKMITAQGKQWHPEHFNCAECGKVLSPNKFFEMNGLPYCEDDFHKLFSPKCAGCNQPIKDASKMVSAQGKKWHPEHFTCTECRKVLSPNDFFEKDGLPYCEDDFYRLFSQKCAGCGLPIKDNKYIFAQNKYWHPDHFKCHQCGRALKENEYYEKDGRVYCLDDFLNLFAPKCISCYKPIKDEYCLVALDGDWHADCFRCKDCNIPLEDKNFYEIDGEPYCEQHFHARQCPDCIKMRRAQNKYFGLHPSTPMGPSRWASQVSLKSLTEETTTTTNTTTFQNKNPYSSLQPNHHQQQNQQDINNRPASQLSQYSTTSFDTAYSGGRSSPNPSGTFIIPIEKEGKMYNNQECGHDHRYSQVSDQFQRSSMKRVENLETSTSNKSKWGSQSNLQYIARNENPYNYLEPGKFPVEPKHIRFSETVTKREFDTGAKYY